MTENYQEIGTVNDPVNHKSLYLLEQKNHVTNDKL
jgi:hypothetical protein